MSDAAAVAVPLLGLCDDYMSRRMNGLTSMTKIGGTPTYFPKLVTEVLTPAQAAQLDSWQRCDICGERMYLLAQAYAPAPTWALLGPSSSPCGSSPPHHRMLYVWCCNSASCGQQSHGSWRACCIQVDQEDLEAFGDEPLEEEEEGESDKEGDDHLEAPLPPDSLPPCTFPPCHVEVVPEPPASAAQPIPAVKSKEMTPEKIEELLRAGKQSGSETVDDLKDLDAKMNLKNAAVDYHFEAFRSRLSREPTQVLRYYPCLGPMDSSNSRAEVAEGLRPLFMNPNKVLLHFAQAEGPSGTADDDADEVELAEAAEREAMGHRWANYTLRQRCRGCGAPLRAEMQILPTALYYLRPAAYPSPKRIKEESKKGKHSEGAAAAGGDAPMEDWCVDFGSVTVYTCSAWCQARQPGVVLEEAYLIVEPAPSVEDESGRQQHGAGRTDLRAFMAGKGGSHP